MNNCNSTRPYSTFNILQDDIIQSVPVEIRNYIFGYLSNLDLVLAGMACKKWKEFAKQNNSLDKKLSDLRNQIKPLVQKNIEEIKNWCTQSLLISEKELEMYKLQKDYSGLKLRSVIEEGVLKVSKNNLFKNFIPKKIMDHAQSVKNKLDNLAQQSLNLRDQSTQLKQDLNDNPLSNEPNDAFSLVFNYNLIVKDFNKEIDLFLKNRMQELFFSSAYLHKEDSKDTINNNVKSHLKLESDIAKQNVAFSGNCDMLRNIEYVKTGRFRPCEVLKMPKKLGTPYFYLRTSFEPSPDANFALVYVNDRIPEVRVLHSFKGWEHLEDVPVINSNGTIVNKELYQTLKNLREYLEKSLAKDPNSSSIPS